MRLRPVFARCGDIPSEMDENILSRSLTPIFLEPRDSRRFNPALKSGKIIVHHSNCGAERRVAERVKTFQPAELVEAGGGCYRVHLLNLSTGGAMVYGRGPDIGAQVSLQGPVTFGEARVAWRREKCFGVAFARALPETFIESLIRDQRQLVERAAERLRQETDPLRAINR